MDTIINLIIILAVIFTVLKRFQEVAQKGVEIKQPPLRRPSMQPSESTAAPSREMTMEQTGPEESSSPVQPSPFPLREMMETLERQYRDITASPLPSMPVSRYEPAAEDAFESLAPSTTPEPALISPIYTSPRTGMMQGNRLSLVFNRDTVLNGMIMSEILGYPVALRTTGPGFQYL